MSVLLWNFEFLWFKKKRKRLVCCKYNGRKSQRCESFFSRVKEFRNVVIATVSMKFVPGRSPPRTWAAVAAGGRGRRATFGWWTSRFPQIANLKKWYFQKINGKCEMYYCETVHHCPLQSEHPDAEVVGHLLHVQALVGEHYFEFPNKKAPKKQLIFKKTKVEPYSRSPGLRRRQMWQ